MKITNVIYSPQKLMALYKSMTLIERRRVYGRARKYMGTMEYRIALELGFHYRDHSNQYYYHIEVENERTLLRNIKLNNLLHGEAEII